MSTYKIHLGPDGAVKGYGPNVDEYQPYIEDGDTILTSDTLPAPTAAELFDRLRIATEQRLAATDQYGMDDYPDNAKRAAFRAYRTALRELNRQPGAPWDGGGDLTPWPDRPSAE